jgi:pSer/pThr/pTyr-binding forkhead associated (FHA) protein
MAYWCNQRLSIALTRQGSAGSVISLAQPFARVGSHPDGDVQLVGHEVPARAYYLHAHPQGAFCIDLRRTATGSLPSGRWLSAGEELQLGPYGLHVSLEPGFDSHVPPRSLDRPKKRDARPSPILGIYGGNRRLAERRLRADLTIVGRWPGCGIELSGRRVSGVHCALYWADGRLWCVDLVSSNGTQLGDEGICCSEVQLGDRLEIGGFGLVFEGVSGLAPAETTATVRRAPEASRDARLRRSKRRSSRSLPAALRKVLVSNSDLVAQAAAAARENGPILRTTALAANEGGGNRTRGLPIQPGAQNAELTARIDAMSVGQLERASARLEGQLELLDAEADCLMAKLEALAAIRFKLEVRRAELLGRLHQTSETLEAEGSPRDALPQRPHALEACPKPLTHENCVQVEAFSHCDSSPPLPQSRSTDRDHLLTGDSPRLNEQAGPSPKEQDGHCSSIATEGLPEQLTPCVISDGKVFAMTNADDAPAPTQTLPEPAEGTAGAEQLGGSSNAQLASDEAATASGNQPPESAPAVEQTTGTSTAVAQPVGQTEAITQGMRKKVGRASRAKNVNQNNLVDFVSDRMITLERQKSRKRLLIGLSVALSVLLVLSAAAGGWYQWGQDYLPVPDSVAEQAPDWMASWFERVATAAR